MLIPGKARLVGEIEVSSSKNAILPILASSLLSDENKTILNVPDIRDVTVITELIRHLGVKADYKDGSLLFSGGATGQTPPYELVRLIRASFLVMGPLLATRERSGYRYREGVLSVPALLTSISRALKL